MTRVKVTLAVLLCVSAEESGTFKESSRWDMGVHGLAVPAFTLEYLTMYNGSRASLEVSS